MRLQDINALHSVQAQRAIQAHALWAQGFGILLGFSSFQEYLDSIPEVPELPQEDRSYFQRLVLVDSRASIIDQCSMLRVEILERNITHNESDTAEKPPVFWMLSQDGSKYFNTLPATCQGDFSGNEIGCNIREGLAMVAQDPTVLHNGRVMDLPRSPHRNMKNHCAGLRLHDGRRQLLYTNTTAKEIGRGSASCYKKA